ncbi:hypothetical protein SUGI_0751730 [Cryptomeria japonica]|nr:hypothetical protein SUGI_0751730 [Cryptomeria japonica]
MEEKSPSRLEQLDWGAATNIVRRLDEPADIARFAAVSKSCRRMVVESRCIKELFSRKFPEVSMFDSVAEDKMSTDVRPGSSQDSEWKNLKRENKIYFVLAREVSRPPVEASCIHESICASSTDNYPQETIANTLDPVHKEAERPSYWSSKGESNSEVPETLTYALHSNLCVVHEVKIRPFRAYFQRGDPIYSANAVRFRFGYSSSSPESNTLKSDRLMSSSQFVSEDYIWTYVSPIYQMEQEDELQTFKLPRPVLCIGGILQVELLGRVQKQEMDGLYYICICLVYVVGRPLSFFNLEVLGEPRKFILKHSEKFIPKYAENGECLGMLEDASRVPSDDEVSGTWNSIAERIRQIRAGRVLAMLGNIGVVNYVAPHDFDSDEEDLDDNSAMF